jgi:hypothetical protein
MEESLKGRDREVASLEEERAGNLKAREDLAGKAAWLEEAQASKDTELDWLRKSKEDRDKELAWLRETIEGLTEERDFLTQNQEQHASELTDLRREAREANAKYSSLEEHLHERLHQVAETGLLALEGQEHVMIKGLVPLFEALDEASGLSGDPSMKAMELGLDRLVGAVEMGLESLKRIESDLAQRVDQMQALSDQAARPFVKFLLSRSGLASRVESWRETGLVNRPEDAE